MAKGKTAQGRTVRTVMDILLDDLAGDIAFPSEDDSGPVWRVQEAGFFDEDGLPVKTRAAVRDPDLKRYRASLEDKLAKLKLGSVEVLGEPKRGSRPSVYARFHFGQDALRVELTRGGKLITAPTVPSLLDLREVADAMPVRSGMYRTSPEDCASALSHVVDRINQAAASAAYAHMASPEFRAEAEAAVDREWRKLVWSKLSDLAKHMDHDRLVQMVDELYAAQVLDS